MNRHDDDDNVKKAVRKSTIADDKIKIAVTDPSLRGRVRADINNPNDGVYWYIKFNMPLDPESVSKHTMRVMETNGYILTSVISYVEKDHMIVIMPIDPYLQNEFYILTVTTDVRSAKGNNLKKEIHILFKLINNQISEFKVLQSTTDIPKPRIKPESEKRKTAQMVSKYYSFTDTLKDVPPDKLPFADVKINVFLGIGGLALVAASLLVSNYIFTIISFVICFIGILHIAAQLSNKSLRSAIYYDLGVISFNGGKYQKAGRRFKKAADLDPDSEYAEYALNKVTFYL